jgi:hypothetical protein
VKIDDIDLGGLSHENAIDPSVNVLPRRPAASYPVVDTLSLLRLLVDAKPISSYVKFAESSSLRVDAIPLHILCKRPTAITASAQAGKTL